MAETTFTLWRQRRYGIADLSCNLVADDLCI